MSYKFQTITKKGMPEYRNAIIDFFGNYRYVEDYALAIDNSAFICVCWLNGKIVGAGRVVSDLSRFAFIVDLNVLENHRHKGIGKKLVKNMVQVCLDSKIRYIELSTDPRYPWLEDFYAKIGFIKINGGASMEWPRR